MRELVDRKTIVKKLHISISQLIRLERNGRMKAACVRIGRRGLRYDASKIDQLIESGSLY